jgi:DNA-binding beta-propeller fold protein YncE
MREDFVTRLQLQLRDAAEREARGGMLGHAFRGARWRLGSPVLAGAAAALAILVAVGTGALLLRDDTAPAGPHVVATLELTENPEQLMPAFGAVWIADPVAGDVVRVDPERRAVTARIPVGDAQQITIQPVGGELWAIAGQLDEVLRIDPATNRVAGTFTLRDPGGREFQALDVLANDRAVWAVSAEGALRLDPRTGDALQRVAAPRGGHEARWFTIGEDTLWVYGTDGVIQRFDAATGALQGRLRPQLAGTQVFGDLAGDVVGWNGDGRVARMDGRTGAMGWQRVVGERIHAADYGAGLLWYFATRPSEPARLLALDPRDGAVVSSVPMPIFGATGLAVIGDEVWIDDAGGRTLVVAR